MKIQLAICMLIVIAALSGCIGFENKSPKGNNTSALTKAPIHTPFPIKNSTVYVEIAGSFDPLEWKVVNGTTVEWTNRDIATEDENKHVVNVSFNGEYFHSPPLNIRQKWNFTFNKTGTFEFSCSNHPWMQHGHIIVE